MRNSEILEKLKKLENEGGAIPPGLTEDLEKIKQDIESLKLAVAVIQEEVSGVTQSFNSALNSLISKF
ncbi:MAG: hypothetical protein ACRCX2_21340 [Paraclostridium sp.]